MTRLLLVGDPALLMTRVLLPAFVSERGMPSFAAADGVLGVSRAMFLPPALYRFYRRARGGR